MKNLIKIILISLIAISINHTKSYANKSGDTTRYYVIPLKKQIDKSSFKMVRDGLDNSIEFGADYCIIDLNTYGGAVDAADSIRNAILNHSIPVIAFINNQAVSAGALISIACDSIYMSKGSSFGAATVVDGAGNVLPDKYQSFMRAMMRSTAESHGKVVVYKDGERVEVWRRDPQLAEKMVDRDSVLSFTPSEAFANNYSEGQSESIKEVIKNISGSNEYVIEQQEYSFIDLIIYFFLNPIVQGILMMMIMGGIYFELQSPGIGFPLAAAVLGAVLYFVPLYLEGLAENWELLIFIIGVGLLIVEIFVLPGFGVAGVSGIIAIIIGLTFSMVDNDIVFNKESINLVPIVKPLAIVLVSTTLSIFFSIFGASKLYGTKAFSHIALKTSLNSNEGYVGVVNEKESDLLEKIGIVVTDLKPNGYIQIDGKRHHAQLQYGYAAKGERVVVKRVKEGYLYVERLAQ